MTHHSRSWYSFGLFLLTPYEGLLLCGPNYIPLTSKALGTLLLLLRKCGQIPHFHGREFHG